MYLHVIGIYVRINYRPNMYSCKYISGLYNYVCLCVKPFSVYYTYGIHTIVTDSQAYTIIQKRTVVGECRLYACK